VITYQLTPEEYAARTKQIAERHRIEITGTDGKIEKMGAVIHYHYDGATLTLDVVEKPFFVSQEQAETLIKQMLG
jgi:hypothetical protein